MCNCQLSLTILLWGKILYINAITMLNININSRMQTKFILISVVSTYNQIKKRSLVNKRFKINNLHGNATGTSIFLNRSSNRIFLEMENKMTVYFE